MFTISLSRLKGVEKKREKRGISRHAKAAESEINAEGETNSD